MPLTYTFFAVVRGGRYLSRENTYTSEVARMELFGTREEAERTLYPGLGESVVEVTITVGEVTICSIQET